eukprot:TRINITY_DN10723_c1_g1_i1.p1 TRINITY_DN10723_c1_g1~~TRINITY_DN10723_c1_g1_i1.p1  ORF type:complete len:702 (+),score=128.40 TRINITY_DN10723_c1_g1_i1:54-2159(+)
MAQAMNEPTGKPVVFSPAHEATMIVPRTPSASSRDCPRTHRRTQPPAACNLHPAASIPDLVERCGPSLLAAGGVPLLVLDSCSLRSSCRADERSVPCAPRRSISALEVQQQLQLQHDALMQGCDALSVEYAEQPLALGADHLWVVVHVCGAGGISVDDELSLKAGDVWACFGNVLLAKRGQQIILCRHAPFAQMINFQCMSDGWDIEFNDSRCAPETWRMQLSQEQACMDSLSGFLSFLMAASSKACEAMGVKGFTGGSQGASLPRWQSSSCAKTNLWATMSAASMWEVVLNGKAMLELQDAESPVVVTSCQKEAAQVLLCGSTEAPASALCQASRIQTPWAYSAPGVYDYSSRSLLREADASAVEIPRIQTPPAPPRFLALEDAEADDEAEVLCEAQLPAGDVALAQDSEGADALAAGDFCDDLPSLLRSPRSKSPRKAHKRQCKAPCPSFMMDAGEAKEVRQRESSLARRYDALDEASAAVASSPTCAFFGMDEGDAQGDAHTCRKRPSSLSWGYDALDFDLSGSQRRGADMDRRVDFDVAEPVKAPESLPPVKGTPSRRTSSRFAARHRATVAAASALAMEYNFNDLNPVESECSSSQQLPFFGQRASVPARHASNIRSRGIARGDAEAGQRPPSAMEMDLRERRHNQAQQQLKHTDDSVMLGSSTSKLPPLFAQQRSTNGASRRSRSVNPLAPRLAW